MAAAKPRLIRSGAPLAPAVLLALTLAACGGQRPAAQPTATSPDRRAAMPAGEVLFVHRSLHRLPRLCRAARTDPRRLDATTARFVELYRRYPADRYEFRVDDESATMLSAVLVLRDELSRCSPRHAARIDPVLPPTVRRALRPLPGARP